MSAMGLHWSFVLRHSDFLGTWNLAFGPLPMPSFRYITLTREGVYYVIVLAFIIGGAVLREVNLLVILAGLMIGPLLFSWRWAAVSLANLSVERRLPRSTAAGDP